MDTEVATAWLLLVVSLPTHGATARMRIWRALKANGCAALRDGAYLLPAGDARGRQRVADERAGAPRRRGADLSRALRSQRGVRRAAQVLEGRESQSHLAG